MNTIISRHDEEFRNSCERLSGSGHPFLSSIYYSHNQNTQAFGPSLHVSEHSPLMNLSPIHFQLGPFHRHSSSNWTDRVVAASCSANEND